MDCTHCQTPLPDQAKFCFSCGTDVGDTGASGTRPRRDQMAELQERLARTLAGRYTVQRLLGQGGMAAVFLAEDLTLERPVAIKVLPPELSRDERVVARFEREAKTAAKLDHAHIIPIHRVESEAGLHYFVMKYVRGRSLEDVLRAAAPVPLDFASRVLVEAASALGHAHKHGVVHRDVKPANIMLDADDRVVLTDFGISKAGDVSAQLTHTGVIVGTPYYMAPEQALGSGVDGRADQYALGIVGFQLLTGQLPFTGDTAHTIIYRHIHDEPPTLAALRAEVPPQLAGALARALAKDPEQRFPTMEAFAAAIEGRAVPHTAAPAARTNSDSGAATVMIGAPAGTAGKTIPLARVAGESSGRRRATLVAGAATLAGILAAAWLAPFRARASAASDSAPMATPAASAGVGTAPPTENRVPANTATPAATTPTASPRSPRPQASETRQTAPLTVATEPYGTLYVDGVEVGDTPVANHPLAVGRAYEVRVEREGYRTKREKITVADPNPIRRRYILEPGDQR